VKFGGGLSGVPKLKGRLYIALQKGVFGHGFFLSKGLK
jgi:hypothetical protein